MEATSGFSELLASHGAWEYDLETEVVTWSDGVYRIHGVRPEHFVPTPEGIRRLIHPDDRDEYRRAFRDAVASKAPFAVQHRIVRPDGAIVTALVRGAHMRSADGHWRVVGTSQDVTGRTGSEERLWHLANHDPLTGLFNRRRLFEELEREIAVARRGQVVGSLLVLDLDRFKEINDVRGHIEGDALLVRVADALQARLRGTDTLARLGGDEFAIVLPGCGAADAAEIATELNRAIDDASKVIVAGRSRRVRASVGIVCFHGGDREAPEELLAAADLAMYRAKAGGGGAEVFDERMRAELAARVRVEAELREALERDQLRVHYQPIVAVADGAPIGCEALVRWAHPRRGLLPPAEFVAVAEEYGLVGQLGNWVLGRACAEAMRWRRSGWNVGVSVNIAPQQLVREDVAASVRDALAVSGLPGALLCLEVTETALREDVDSMLPALDALKELGVRLAIDDFGGGSSSLGMLRALPVDEIKIDRVFIEGIAERADDRAIVAAVLSLAEELGLSVVAEGVEDERQHAALRELGCRQAQGFLYARPAPPAELRLDAYTATVQPGVGDPYVIREFMRQIGIPARVGV